LLKKIIFEVFKTKLNSLRDSMIMIDQCINQADYVAIGKLLALVDNCVCLTH